jgi:hypothetical protein
MGLVAHLHSFFSRAGGLARYFTVAVKTSSMSRLSAKRSNQVDDVTD